ARTQRLDAFVVNPAPHGAGSRGGKRNESEPAVGEKGCVFVFTRRRPGVYAERGVTGQGAAEKKEPLGIQRGAPEACFSLRAVSRLTFANSASGRTRNAARNASRASSNLPSSTKAMPRLLWPSA